MIILSNLAHCSVLLHELVHVLRKVTVIELKILAKRVVMNNFVNENHTKNVTLT